MKRDIARHISSTRLVALALVTLCFVQPPAVPLATATSAGSLASPAYDHRDGPSHFDFPPIGFVPGQTLRLTVAHVSGQAGQDQVPPDVSVGVWLLDSSGRRIAQSAEVQIPRNEFHFFDFNRAALNLPGEPGTGRMQVRARLVLHVAEPYHFTDAPKATALLAPSLELVDISTGETAAGICCANNLKQIGIALT
jgi:hypothetical protein